MSQVLGGRREGVWEGFIDDNQKNNNNSESNDASQSVCVVVCGC